jgi:hypothetical protein
MEKNNEFSYRRCGTTGCEILFNGIVVAWTVEDTWAALLTQLLDYHTCVTVGAGDGCPRQLVAVEEERND